MLLYLNGLDTYSNMVIVNEHPTIPVAKYKNKAGLLRPQSHPSRHSEI
jgi:hypothetical protein